MAEEGNKEALKEKTLRAQRWFFTVGAIIGVCVLIAGAAQLIGVLSTPMGVILWTVVIVFALRGVVSKFVKLGMNRLAATSLAYVIMVAVLAVIIVLMCSPMFGVGDQFNNLLSSAPTLISDTSNWVQQLYAQYAYVLDNATVQQYVQDLASTMTTMVQQMARESANGVVNITSGLANAVMVIGIAAVVAFWILLELPDLGKEMARLVGDRHREDVDMLYVTFTRVMGGYLKATLIQCAVIGVCCGILFFVLGIPNFAALGVITGILNIIPIIGPWLGGAVAAGVGLFISPLVAVIAVVGAIVIQQFVYTFVSPQLMSDSVDVHPALTLLALMFGSALGGACGGLMGSLVGMLISIPAVAVLKSVFVYYFEKRTGRPLVHEEGVFFQGTPSEGEGVDPILDATSPHPDIYAAAKERAEKMAAGETLPLPLLFPPSKKKHDKKRKDDDKHDKKHKHDEKHGKKHREDEDEVRAAVQEAAPVRPSAAAPTAGTANFEEAAQPAAKETPAGDTGEVPAITQKLATIGLDRMVTDDMPPVSIEEDGPQ